MGLFSGNLSALMFFAGVGMLIFILLKRHWRYHRRREKVRGSKKVEREFSKAAPSADRPLADAPREVLRWQVEMHETARDLKAELDSKLSALQALVKIAAEERASLQAAIARAERLGVSTCTDTLDEIERLAEFDSSNSKGSLGNLPSIAPTQLDSGRNTSIYKLADRGNSPAAIADQLGETLGEVELILSLRVH